MTDDVNSLTLAADWPYDCGKHRQRSRERQGYGTKIIR